MTQPPSASGRDPRQPFGSPASPSAAGGGPLGAPEPRSPAPGKVARAQAGQFGYAPPPRRPRWWMVLVGVLALCLLGWAAMRLSQDPASPDPAAATSTPSEASFQPTSAPATPMGVRTQVPFENGTDNSSGTFEVVGHSWDSQGLTVTLRVHLDTGSQRLGFFALDNNLATDYSPSSGDAGSLQGQTITAGQTLTGTVVFLKPRGDTTIFLADSTGRQVTALVVKG